jgi:hypothetical protein
MISTLLLIILANKISQVLLIGVSFWKIQENVEVIGNASIVLPLAGYAPSFAAILGSMLGLMLYILQLSQTARMMYT